MARIWAGMILACAALCLRPAAAAAPTAPPLPVKVMIINMFGPEAAPWVTPLALTREIRVPGLSSDYPQVRCSADGVCQLTTGMGHANAAASTMAVLFSGLFDLQRTYFIIAGIAGIDPERGTIGSVAWARYAVDFGIAHEIDLRDLPKGWHDNYFGVLTKAPGEKPRMEYRTELFQLDETLLQRVLSLSQHAMLEDSDDVRAYRQHFRQAAASAPPQVIVCDTASGDTWWAGDHLGEHARSWTRLLTDGAGVYCTTQQEDNATLVALTRAAQAGLVDIKRVAIMRSGSDFDRPYPHQGALEGLTEQLALPGAGRISCDNLLRAGQPVVEDIVRRWQLWRDGVPPAP